MTMFSTKYPNVSRTVSGANVVVYNNDVILAVDTALQASSINLGQIAAGYWNTTWKLYVYDSSNNATVNNITINAGSGQKINNSSSIVIALNGGGALIRIINNTNFIASSTVTAGGITSITASSPLTSTGGSTPIISTSMSTNRLIGRGSAGTGVMEEIILGTGLSLSGTTLNVTFPSAVTSVATTGLISGGTITSTGTITTSMATNKLVGRGTAGTGIMEEITLGTNLSLSGNTLNAAGGGYNTIQDEGIAVPVQTTVNFIGDGVTATDDAVNSRTNVTIRAYSIIQDETTFLTQRSKLNFLGAAVTVTDNPGNESTDVTITSGTNFLHAEKNLFLTTSSYSPAGGTTRSVISGTSINEWSTKTESGVTGFNTGSGIWTVAAAGWYSLNARLVTRINSVSIDDNTDAIGNFWMASATDIGFVSIGIILSSAGGNTRMIASNKQAITQTISDINIDTTCESYYFNVGDALNVRILNKTNNNVQGFASSASLPDCIFEFTAIKIS
jgi:hypothetical protein